MYQNNQSELHSVTQEVVLSLLQLSSLFCLMVLNYVFALMNQSIIDGDLMN
ncbi:hypothetical protein SynBIOSU31_01729 [Synechococcus sp. BIOS-U3-1]|nr:hypothetical protein SynBIOSU31_01729 [Synechococcus sp. BIOS-U3-1]